VGTKRNMNKKRCHETSGTMWLELACGMYVGVQSAEPYALHCCKCLLCATIRFEDALDMRYNISLPCGTEFMRALSRMQWIKHVIECTQCAAFEFEDLEPIQKKLLREHMLVRTKLTELEGTKSDLNFVLANIGKTVKDDHVCTTMLIEKLESYIEDGKSEQNIDTWHNLGSCQSIFSWIVDMHMQSHAFEKIAVLVENASKVYEKYLQEKPKLIQQRDNLQTQLFELCGSSLKAANSYCFSVAFSLNTRVCIECPTSCAEDRSFFISEGVRLNEIAWCIGEYEYNIKVHPIIWNCFWRCLFLNTERILLSLIQLPKFVPASIVRISQSYAHVSVQQFLDALHDVLGWYAQKRKGKRCFLNEAVVLQEIQTFIMKFLALENRSFIS